MLRSNLSYIRNYRTVSSTLTDVVDRGPEKANPPSNSSAAGDSATRSSSGRKVAFDWSDSRRAADFARRRVNERARGGDDGEYAPTSDASANDKRIRSTSPEKVPLVHQDGTVNTSVRLDDSIFAISSNSSSSGHDHSLLDLSASSGAANASSSLVDLSTRSDVRDQYKRLQQLYDKIVSR